MNEIKHPKTVQELLEVFLPNYSSRDDVAELNDHYVGIEEHYENYMHAIEIKDKLVSEALESYRIECEKSAWERACGKMKEECIKSAEFAPVYEECAAVENTPTPEFEPTK